MVSAFLRNNELWFGVCVFTMATRRKGRRCRSFRSASATNHVRAYSPVLIIRYLEIWGPRLLFEFDTVLVLHLNRSHDSPIIVFNCFSGILSGYPVDPS